MRPAHWLTLLTAAAMAVVSAGGAFGAGWLYRDNPLISATFQGQDLVTLFVAVPLLLAGLVLERRGSSRGRALWLGMLFFSMYGYLFYAVGAAFNAFFLLYVACFGLPLYALLLAVPRIEPAQLVVAGDHPLTRAVAIGYQLVVAAGLGLLWTGISAGYLFTGEVPAPIVASGHPTGVVFAIDLVFIVPPMLMGAVALIRRRAIGWALALVMSISGTVYTLSLAVGSIATVRAGVGTGAELPIWVGLTGFGAVTAALLLVRLGAGTAAARSAGQAGERAGSTHDR